MKRWEIGIAVFAIGVTACLFGRVVTRYPARNTKAPAAVETTRHTSQPISLDEIRRNAAPPLPTYTSKTIPKTSSPSRTTSRVQPHVAENGSYYGQISKNTGRPKTVHVKGYYRKDGTYVRGHYRSRPKHRKKGTYVRYKTTPKTSSPSRTTSRAQSHVAENGSYYGQTSRNTGRPKTVYVGGYYRKDGTYVRGHYRSKPRRR